MVLLNRSWKRQMNLMVSLRMCSAKISTAKSRSQICLHTYDNIN